MAQRRLRTLIVVFRGIQRPTSGTPLSVPKARDSLSALSGLVQIIWSSTRPHKELLVENDTVSSVKFDGVTGHLYDGGESGTTSSAPELAEMRKRKRVLVHTTYHSMNSPEIMKNIHLES